MNTMEAIYERRSVRRFSEEPVSAAEIQALLEAGVQAPTATNSQPWLFAVIQGSGVLKEISDGAKEFLLANMHKMLNLEKYRKVLSKDQYNIFYNAGSLIVIYAKQEGPHPEYDCCLAAQNMMLTATQMQLGTCWIGFAGYYLDLPEIKERLNIPQEYKAVAPLILGHPKFKMPQVKKKPPHILCWIKE